jgi:hypothetical protein
MSKPKRIESLFRLILHETRQVRPGSDKIWNHAERRVDHPPSLAREGSRSEPRKPATR